MTEKSFIAYQNEPVKAMKKLKLQLAASKRIVKDNGLTMFSITGKQQGGKSSYAMLILNEVYGGDVEQVMSHIVFTIEDFTKILRGALDGGYRERCILWDDASLTGSAARWMVDPKMVMYLSGLGDTLGIATKSLILTSPNGDLVKAFRSYPKYKIMISNGRHKYDRVARGYWIGKSPMEQRYCQVEFEDAYDTRIPFYERYAEKRKELSLMAVRNMEALMNNTDSSSAIPEHKPTIKERVEELRRDLEAGVFGNMTFKAVCKANRINYGTAKNYV